MDATEPLRDRRVPLIALSLLVFAGAFLYRFNALLGSLSGFDGDHFIYYLGSISVLRGERPLRDFADAGLQGAWPALTYELSALAQRIGGESLLSEAVLCVGAVALSAALLFRTAASVAGVWASLVVTLLSLATSTRLYGYHKVLVSSVAVALLLHYARAPSRSSLGLMAVWSAVAFLFRHDYLVYVALASVCLIVILPGQPLARRARLAIAYVALTGVLLLGPLYSVHHFVGWGSYFSSNSESTRREATRTDLEWPAFESVTGPIAFFGNEVNAVSWLYYMCLLLPAAGLGVAALGQPRLPGLDVARSRAVLLTLALYAAVLNHFFLRGNLAARFGDLGAPIAVLGAWLAGTAPAALVPRVAARTGLAVLTVAAFLAVNTTGSVWQELATTGLRLGAKPTYARALEVAPGLSNVPPPPAAAPAERHRTGRASPTVVDYLRACTRPDDRVLMLADASEVAVFAGRLFAGGHPTFRAGFYTLPADQALTIARLSRQSVPVVLTRDWYDYKEHIDPDFEAVAAWVNERYEYRGHLPALTGGLMGVLVRREMGESEPFGHTNLPCPY
jgi:hypothetical protein